MPLGASEPSNEVDKNINAESIKRYSSEEALKISQDALRKRIGHYQLQSASGETVSTAQFQGKPLIISLVYTSCYHICPTTTQSLNRVVQKAKQVLGGSSFNVATIGFDSANDTPEAMKQFAEGYGSLSSNWYFLSADQGTVNALARDTGFIYTPSASGFDHLIQATIIDQHGSVYRQVYGMEPQTPHFVEPLKELIFGQPVDDSFFSQLTSKVKLFCTIYDPKQDRYYFNYSIFIGLLVGLVMGGFFITLFIREWRLSSNKYSKSSTDQETD